ncbi:FAD binding domain-containing protein [Agromyces sp. SYSU T00194]|uniref:FAD binding domain-containing protein n=1 Tax=Agromyces chitinivorans TaxID=3158560 RepID=UPI00339B5650
MDLETVRAYRRATTRDDLALAPGERFVAGGTWLYSEPQVGTTGLVDLTTMGWAPLEEVDGGLRIGATCTIAELVAHPAWAPYPSHPLVFQCASALLASFKIWNAATVGGNVCRSFAAAGMVSLAVTLDGEAVVWAPDGGELRRPVADLVTGNGTNDLGAGEVLRAIDLPAHALAARTAFRKIALAELGRSGAVLTGRVDDDGRATFAITAATERPTVLRFDRIPDATTLRRAVEDAPGYYTDPLGTADWRRAVSVALLEDVREELAA